MEFDNDRKIHPAYKTEIYFWIVFMLLNPVVNTITFFWFNSVFLIALLFISVMSFPFYILYARVIVPKSLFAKKPTGFIIMSIAFFIFMLFWMSGINAFISLFSLKLPERFYLSYSTRTLVRD